MTSINSTPKQPLRSKSLLGLTRLVEIQNGWHNTSIIPAIEKYSMMNRKDPSNGLMWVVMIRKVDSGLLS